MKLPLLILLASCGDKDDDTGGTEAAPMTYDEFVDAYSLAWCEWYIGCWQDMGQLNGFGTVSLCMDPAQGVRFITQWDSDCYGYDVEAADACLAPYLAADECDTTEVEDYDACAAVCASR